MFADSCVCLSQAPKRSNCLVIKVITVRYVEAWERIYTPPYTSPLTLLLFYLSTYCITTMEFTPQRTNLDTTGTPSSVLFAFDVYGTLFDTSSVLKMVAKYVDGPKLAQDITNDWRMYQLE